MRNWVYRALCAVIIDQTYSNLYLKKHLQEVDEKDQALATKIFYGTIQNYRYCQYVLQQFCTKKTSRSLEILLCMSIYQLKFLDKVPSYAIVNEAVLLAKKKSQKQANFVNAILHKILQEEVQMPTDPIEALSVETSVQPWLLSMWKAQYGYDLMESMARSTLETMPIYVRFNPLKINEKAILENEEISQMDGQDLLVYQGSSIFDCDLYKKGLISVQDDGSYQISRFMHCQAGEHILDCCSAPGTKAMAMAEQMHDQGHIDCLDIHAHRVELIKNDAKRLGITICHGLCKDATKLEDLGLYDRILCDVPCSGYGIMARKPDIKLHMNSQDMDSLIPLQAAILESSSHHLKENGTLVYSTCTMNKKENEKQVEAFLKRHPEFTCDEMKTITPNHHHDGFFMARMIKQGGHHDL